MRDNQDSRSHRKHRINIRGMLTCGYTAQVRPSHEIEGGDCPVCGREVSPDSLDKEYNE